ncbi:hypothetical protein PL321_12525 [Caloramator sp. mosi_1]|uniref:hypothetical protein n=1 Tax=Caloramator sp. mosi_1 TaxID=3023090 RepID=UPI002360105A|nr:hypothetical protein [Caloramator sp. mosi_1]WDC83519.1 hypothetical protein PL321_12525 [Caloramator sp. mosi_1]
MHIIVGYFGGWLIKRGIKYELVLLIILPVHALLEAFIVIPIVGLDYRMFYIVAVGTAIHHLIDSAISVFFARTTGLYTLKNQPNRLIRLLTNTKDALIMKLPLERISNWHIS